MGNAEYMGIHNSSSLSLEQRVANPKKNHKKQHEGFYDCLCLDRSLSLR